MSVITRSGAVLETAVPPTNSLLGGYQAGETLAGLDALYLKGADGLLYKADGTNDDEKARCIGFAAVARSAGKGVTILRNLVVSYSTGLTPGTFLYLSTTPGALQTTAPAGNPNPVAHVLDANSIFIFGTVAYSPGMQELSAMAANIPQAAIVSVAGAVPAGGTGAAAGGFDTSGNRDTFIATVGEMKTKFNQLLVELRTAGIIIP